MGALKGTPLIIWWMRCSKDEWLSILMQGCTKDLTNSWWKKYDLSSERRRTQCMNFCQKCRRCSRAAPIIGKRKFWTVKTIVFENAFHIIWLFVCLLGNRSKLYIIRKHRNNFGSEAVRKVRTSYLSTHEKRLYSFEGICPFRSHQKFVSKALM